MAGTTGLEPATSAVTGQRSDQLSYVPRLFFNNLAICHIESSVSQLSPFSLHSTSSPLWTQFWALVDTKVDTKTATATTRLSLSDEMKSWCPLASRRTKKMRPMGSLRLTYFPHFAADGNSKPDNCSTCRRKTEGFIPSEPQMSKMLRKDGLVFPNSMRLMKARS